MNGGRKIVVSLGVSFDGRIYGSGTKESALISPQLILEIT
jgi:hypothetical protein